MKFKRFVDGTIITYYFESLDEAKSCFDEWKREFIKTNRVDLSRTDTYYDRFCNELANFLRLFPMDENLDIESCKICKAEDHEGRFCRCESRNIAIAKILREKGLSPWE